MVVQHNLMAMNSNRMLGLTQKSVSSATEKLSSGYRINRAADDAAGLSISEKMRKQIRGLTKASSNAEDGISCVQTAEGALSEVEDMLQRMNELAVQAANGTNSTNDRQYIQDEVDQLISEIDRVAETTKFNETYLLKGSDTSQSSKVYTTNYSVTYTKNIVSNATQSVIAKDGQAVNALSFKTNYIGTNNVYIVSASIYTSGTTNALSATKVSNGSDITEFMKQDLADGTDANSAVSTATNLAGAKLNTSSYVAFIAVEMNSEVKTGSGGKVFGDLATTSATDKLKYDLSTDGTSSIVRASRDLAIYNTETESITHIKAGSDMTEYLNGDNTMKDEYRLVDVLTGSSAEISGTSTAGDTVTSNRVKEQLGIAAADDFVWDNTKLQLDESLQSLYDADGNKVSGMKLNSYFDENGNYKGGLYTTAQARASDEVFASTYSTGYRGTQSLSGKAATTIGLYISQTSQTVAGDLSFSLQVGADSDRTNKITAKISSLTSAGLGVDKLSSKRIGIVDSTGDNATDAIDVIADAIAKISRTRSSLGAVQNRLDHTINNLDNVVENTQSAESAIRDTDMASTMVNYSNANILSQAGQSMLAQANQSNQSVLSILG